MQSVIDDTIVKSTYFQAHLNKLLDSLQPSYFCLNLILKVLVGGPDGSGKKLLARAAAKCLNMKFQEHQVFELIDDSIHATQDNLKKVLNQEFEGPCLIYVSGYELFLTLETHDLLRVSHCIRETLEIRARSANQPVIFIASTDELTKVYNSPLTDIFPVFISMKNPTRSEAIDILQNLSQEICIDIDATGILEGLPSDDYHIGNLRRLLSQVEFEKAFPSEESLKNKNNKDKVEWVDVGGLSEVKKEIIDTIQMPTKYPQLRKSGLRRTGILLYGPPGTGKTLLARAVASECGLNFININGPELLSEYVGQSEDNVRKLFQQAKDSAPSVIFFDELDSLAPNRGQAGDSGGVMDRVVSQILTEMDSIRKDKDRDVFVIAATNRVDLVDPSLQRPGRFDKVLEVPLPGSRESRLQILEALTRKMKLADDVDLELVESEAPALMSGADFYGLCSRAEQEALDRAIDLLESGNATSEHDVDIVTNLNDFLVAAREQLQTS